MLLPIVARVHDHADQVEHDQRVGDPDVGQAEDGVRGQGQQADHGDIRSTTTDEDRRGNDQPGSGQRQHTEDAVDGQGVEPCVVCVRVRLGQPRTPLLHQANAFEPVVADPGPQHRVPGEHRQAVAPHVQTLADGRGDLGLLAEHADVPSDLRDPTLHRGHRHHRADTDRDQGNSTEHGPASPSRPEQHTRRHGQKQPGPPRLGEQAGPQRGDETGSVQDAQQPGSFRPDQLCGEHRGDEHGHQSEEVEVVGAGGSFQSEHVYVVQTDREQHERRR